MLSVFHLNSFTLLLRIFNCIDFFLNIKYFIKEYVSFNLVACNIFEKCLYRHESIYLNNIMLFFSLKNRSVSVTKWGLDIWREMKFRWECGLFLRDTGRREREREGERGREREREGEREEREGERRERKVKGRETRFSEWLVTKPRRLTLIFTGAGCFEGHGWNGSCGLQFPFIHSFRSFSIPASSLGFLSIPPPVLSYPLDDEVCQHKISFNLPSFSFSGLNENGLDGLLSKEYWTSLKLLSI